MASRRNDRRIVRRPRTGITEDRTLLTVTSFWPAVATLALGAALLFPRYARQKNAALRADEFAGAVTAAALAEAPRDAASATALAVAGEEARANDPAADYHETAAREAADVHRNGKEGVVEAPADVLAVSAPRTHPDRKAPLTRLPLRARTRAVAWPRLLEPGVEGCTRDDRHRLLEAMGCADAAPHEAILIAAYREEDAEGRALALRGLKQHRSSDARALFEEALRDGRDEERAAAVDALTACGARESLAAALTDPVDAIAARAALAYVGSRERSDYHIALNPFVDSARIETLLSLLAGYLA